MNKATIAVTSDSFSFNTTLRDSLSLHFPNCKFKQDKTKFSKSALIDYLKDCDGAIIGLEKIDQEIIDSLPRLKIVAKYGVGTDNLDLDYLKIKNIAVGWTPGLNKNSVSELAVSQMISMSRNLFTTGTKLKNGIWDKNGGRELSALTVGVLGVGHIGKEVIKKLKVFGCKIMAHDILDIHDFCRDFQVESVTFNELVTKADILSIHVPLNHNTKNLIGKSELTLMKSGSMLLNTARGGIVDETSLYEALASNHLHAACLDVFDEEPAINSPLLKLPNFIATPHIAGNSQTAVLAMGHSAINHLNQFFGKQL